MGVQFTVNPFAGVFDHEIPELIVPAIDITALKKQIEDAQDILVEFKACKGMGKTTHLKYLREQFQDASIYFLGITDSYQDVLACKSSVVFIDGLYKLSLIKRLRILMRFKKIVYTCHTSFAIEAFLVARQRVSKDFNRISAGSLQEVLNKRLLFYVKDTKGLDLYSNEDALSLIKKFGGNYRMIINSLFDTYQSYGNTQETSCK